MKVLHIEGLTTHDGSESCAISRETDGEALTGVLAGEVLSREIRQFEVPTSLSEAEGNTSLRVTVSSGATSRGRRPSACRDALCAGTGRSQQHPRRLVPLGRVGKAEGHDPTMYVAEKSDERVVPKKAPNKGDCPAEGLEGRRSTKGNTSQQNAPRTQRRNQGARSALARVRQTAMSRKEIKFTSLMHHVTKDLLRECFYALRKNASPGVDNVTWEEYAHELEARLTGLHDRVQAGKYRAKPVRRVYIPKANGQKRPLGIAALEDKIVQRAMVVVLNAIYESDFMGFSYGFRPGRGAHQALDALAYGIQMKKVNYVVDADIRGFFDSIKHEWLYRFIQHRVNDPRVLRLLRKWLRAGVMESGLRKVNDSGSPQGAPVSPLLANIYLHYVFDLWAHRWRRKTARGDVIIVRYCDDFVVGFQHEADAKRFMFELFERLNAFGLCLHEEKTRLIPFGRFASSRMKERKKRKPPTFDFLGFTHICGRSRNGKFSLWRWTCRDRLRGKLRALGAELKKRRHQAISVQGEWLSRILRGHYAYFGVPTNIRLLDAFRTQLIRSWWRALRRRSQRHRLNWMRMNLIASRWLPPPRVVHPWPSARFGVMTRGKSPVR